MSALAQARRASPPGGDGHAEAAPASSELMVPFLQRSGIGPARFVADVQDTLASGGRALDAPVRNAMQEGFGRDFSAVRIHDDARAHDSARQAEAAAYTVGEQIVFGQGRYQPESPGGRALLAHELAHTIQQGGLQFMRLDGRALGDHPALEAEADRASAAALDGASPTPLTRIGAPHLARAADNFAKEKGGNTLKTLGLDSLGFVEAASEEVVDGRDAISVIANTALHVRPKGKNTWVAPLWQRHADAGQLVFQGVVSSGRLPALKETGAKYEEYRGDWLGAYGFAGLPELGRALTKLLENEPGKIDKKTAKEAAGAAKNFTSGNLGGSQVANIDHIVEKQVKGTSIPENMQILNAKENQESGRKLNEDIVKQANAVLEASRKTYRMVRMRYKSVVVDPSPALDAYDEIERLLRDKELKPKADLDKAKPSGTAITLQAGAARAKIYVEDAPGAQTKIADSDNASARRLISGFDLQTYQRGKGKKVPEHVDAVVDSERLKGAIGSAKGKHSKVELDANESPAAADDGTELRDLKISGKTKELDFVFPYLSPGKFTKLGVAADNSLEAEGYITPSLKFLKRVDVKLAKDTFSVIGDLGPDKFQPPFRGFKVTESSLALQLTPEFRPSGTIGFTIGPAQKPYAVGSVTAGLDGLNVVLDGKLDAKNLPGVESATGTVRFHQAEGWSGELKGTTSKLPRTKKAEVLFGFRTQGPATQYYASGAIQFDVGAGKDLTIGADWKNDRLVYSGRLVWEKPIKLVDQVGLDFTYDGETLKGSGETAITYKKFNGKLKVHYLKKGAEEAQLSGSGAVDVKTDKAEGSLALNVDPKGVISGKGSVAYTFSDKLKPTVGVILHPDGHLTLTGKIEITKPIEVFPKFPKEGGERDLIKVNVDFIIPGPFPGLADPMVHLAAGVRFSYGIGPGQIVGTVIEGSFDPLEENKHAKLKLTSTFEVPGHVGLTGILEAGLGIAVLGGLAAKVHGGLRVEPGFTLQLITKVPITAQYEEGEFSFEGRLLMQGGLVLGLAIKLYAHAEAIGGALAKDFTYELKNYRYDVGQQMTLTLAKIGYSSKTGFKAPSLSDIQIDPKSVDPVAMIRKIGETAKAALAGRG